jgi:hypothetical protein
MGRMRRPELALYAVEMSVEQNAKESFRHGVGWIYRAANIEIFHESPLDPFLRCKVLNIQVAGTTTRAVVI